MKIILYFLIATLLVTPLLFSEKSVSRRSKRNLEDVGSKSRVATVQKNFEDLEYTNIDNIGKLHRLAIEAFYLKKYGDSEACFGLALKKYTQNKALLLDYALCSALYPESHRSLVRSQKLMASYASGGHDGDDKALVVDAIIRFQSGDAEGFEKQLSGIRSKYWSRIKTELELAHQSKKSLLTVDVLEKILRRKESGQEKRARD